MVPDPDKPLVAAFDKVIKHLVEDTQQSKCFFSGPTKRKSEYKCQLKKFSHC